MTSIIALSHRLHALAQADLRRIFPDAHFHEEIYYFEDRDMLVPDIKAIVNDLEVRGALKGRVVITPPPVSAAAALFMVAIHQKIGYHPDVVNMLQQRGVYRPSSGCPVFWGTYAERSHRDPRDRGAVAPPSAPAQSHASTRGRDPMRLACDDTIAAATSGLR